MIFTLPGSNLTIVLNEPIKDTSGKEVAWRWGTILKYGEVQESIVVNHSSYSN